MSGVSVSREALTRVTANTFNQRFVVSRAAVHIYYNLRFPYVEQTSTGRPLVAVAVVMGDEDRKPRHKLNAEDLLEETNGAIQKIVALLESSGLAAESVEHLHSLVKALDFMVNAMANACIRSTPVQPHGGNLSRYPLSSGNICDAHRARRKRCVFRNTIWYERFCI